MVGYKFKKKFPDSKWYSGVIVKVLDSNNFRVQYPEDDDFEDLSRADLERLAAIEKSKGPVEPKPHNDLKHNDLCECCGSGGQLLCCSTCTLVFHLGCARPKLLSMPDGDWICAFCVASGTSKSKQEKQKASLAIKEIEALKAEALKREEEKEASRRKSPRVAKGVI